MKIHDSLLNMPYLSITRASKNLNLSIPAVTNAVQKLVEIGLLREVTGHVRNRLFGYSEYLEILSAGTAPLKN